MLRANQTFLAANASECVYITRQESLYGVHTLPTRLECTEVSTRPDTWHTGSSAYCIQCEVRSKKQSSRGSWRLRSYAPSVRCMYRGTNFSSAHGGLASQPSRKAPEGKWATYAFLSPPISPPRPATERAKARVNMKDLFYDGEKGKRLDEGRREKEIFKGVVGANPATATATAPHSQVHGTYGVPNYGVRSTE